MTPYSSQVRVMLTLNITQLQAALEKIGLYGSLRK